MLAYYLVGFALASAITLTDAQKTSTCRKPSIFQNIDISRSLGHWYEYGRHHNDFQAGCDCLTSEFVAVDPNNVQLSNCCQMTHVSNETQSCGIGVNRVTLKNSAASEASFHYTRAGALESHLWVVDTDYDHYMIVNGCDRVSEDDEREVFWILSRDRMMSPAEINKIDEVLRANNFDKDKIIKQRHEVDL